jgi:hypothetical protein
LGNFYGKFGKQRRALDLYKKASMLGSHIGELNAAHMLELLGNAKESRTTFALAIVRAQTTHKLMTQALPSFHIKIRKATVLPRVMPLESELAGVRREFEQDLDVLLATEVLISYYIILYISIFISYEFISSTKLSSISTILTSIYIYYIILKGRRR